MWSILEPFGEDFVPNQAKSDPTNLGEPGYGFWLFFQLGTLDFEGSKKALETS